MTGMTAHTSAPNRPQFFWPAISLRTCAVALVTIAIALFLIQSFEFNQVVQTAQKLPALVIAVAVGALTLAFAVSCFRYGTVLAAIGLQIPFKVTARANLIGVVGGLLLFQLLGQTLTRSAILKRYGVSASAVLLANVYERGTALFSLLVMAGLAAFALFGQVTVDLFGGSAPLAKIIILLIAVFAATSLFAYRRLLIFGLRIVAPGDALTGLIRIAVPTILVHLCVLGAYVTLGHSVAPEVAIIDLIAASTIVMFASSMPISFAGWGVREISAVYAYGAIGIGVEQALVVSVTIGILSLLLLLSMAAMSMMLRSIPDEGRQAAGKNATITRSLSIERGFGWAVPILAGMLVFFQIHLPVHNGTINVNLADPIAIVGGLIFFGRYIQTRGDKTDHWRIAGFDSLILLATLIISAGFVNGMMRFGVTDWALYNRFLGWFILLGYLGTGALIVASAGRIGLTVLATTMLVTVLAMGLFDYLVILAISQGLELQAWLPTMQFSGLAQNRNAFAFQILVLLSITLTLMARKLCTSKPFWRSFEMMAAMILLGVLVYTKSRTGIITGCCVLMMVAALRWLPVTKILTIIAGAAAIVAIPWGLMHLSSLIGDIFGLSSAVNGRVFDLHSALSLQGGNALSDNERWYSITRGMEMWFENPILGSGLGAFVNTMQAEKDLQLVIHNTAVWILAEFGIIGIASFTLIFSTIAMSAWRQAAAGERTGQAIILLLIIFAIFQIPHDIFYQRIFWLTLGALAFGARLSRRAPALRNAAA